MVSISTGMSMPSSRLMSSSTCQNAASRRMVVLWPWILKPRFWGANSLICSVVQTWNMCPSTLAGST